MPLRKANRVICITAVGLSLLISISSATAAPTPWIDGPTDQIIGGYLEPGKGCSPSTEALLGWPAGSIRQCRYSVTDSYVGAAPQTKTGIIYVADVTFGRLRTWLQTACSKVEAGDITSCISKEALIVRQASGAQFPVLGLVWEDQFCSDPRGSAYVNCIRQAADERGGDGINEPYVFHNGVTVKIAEIVNGDPNRKGTAKIYIPGDEELKEVLAAPVTGIIASKGYGRIASTSRADFQRLTGTKDIPVGLSGAKAATQWSDIVGDTYRRALSANENPLITARVCADYNWPAACINNAVKVMETRPSK